MARELRVIASEVIRDWGHKMYFGAKPYASAMLSLGKMDEMYGADTAESVVAYFLSNAETWRGPVARRVKAELNQMLKEHRRANPY